VVGQPEDSEEKLIVWFARPRTGSAATLSVAGGRPKNFKTVSAPTVAASQLANHRKYQPRKQRSLNGLVGLGSEGNRPRTGPEPDLVCDATTWKDIFPHPSSSAPRWKAISARTSSDLHEGRGEMTEKLYLYDAVDATPRFVVHGSRVCRLNGEAVFVIDGDARTMTPIGADKPVFKLQGGWVVRVRTRRLVVAADGKGLGRRGQAVRRGQPDCVTRSSLWRPCREGEGRRPSTDVLPRPGPSPPTPLRLLAPRRLSTLALDRPPDEAASILATRRPSRLPACRQEI